MAEHKNIFPIVKMSEAFGVSRNGYYSLIGREPSDRAKENQRLLRWNKQIWLNSVKIYVSPRIHQKLLRGGRAIESPKGRSSHKKRRHPEPDSPLMGGKHGFKTSTAGGTEPVRSGVYHRTIRLSLGKRHHLYSQQSRLVVLKRQASW